MEASWTPKSHNELLAQKKWELVSSPLLRDSKPTPSLANQAKEPSLLSPHALSLSSRWSVFQFVLPVTAPCKRLEMSSILFKLPEVHVAYIPLAALKPLQNVHYGSFVWKVSCIKTFLYKQRWFVTSPCTVRQNTPTRGLWDHLLLQEDSTLQSHKTASYGTFKRQSHKRAVSSLLSPISRGSLIRVFL